MRICLMNDHFYRSSGAAIAIKRIAEALVGVDYYVAGCSSKGYPEDLSWIPSRRYRRFDLTSSNPLQVLQDLRRFKSWFNEERFDLVHCHHRRVAVLLQSVALPVLYTGQLTFPYELWFRWLHPKAMTAVSPSVAENYFETTRTRALACISNPVPFPERPPHVEVPAVNHNAVCVARLEPIKGHKHLLAAWKLLYERGHRFTLDLVGEGSLRPDLEAQAKQDGTQQLIRFCGFTRDVSRTIERSLFVILASEREGHPIVCLEAAAAGRPSLVTAVPGSVDVLPPGRRLVNGVEFGNPQQLAAALEEWFLHPHQVIEEGELFFNFLKATTDPRMVADKYKAVYRSVLTAHHSPAQAT